MGGVTKIDADSNSHSLYLESFDKLVRDPNCFVKCKPIISGNTLPPDGYLSKASAENGVVIYQTGKSKINVGFHCKALHAIGSSGPKFGAFYSEEFEYINVGYILHLNIYKDVIAIFYAINQNTYFEDSVRIDNSLLLDNKTWKFIYIEIDAKHITIYLNNSQHFSYSFRESLDRLDRWKPVGYGFYFSEIAIYGKHIDNLYFDKTSTLKTSAIVSVLDVIDYQRFAGYDEEYNEGTKEGFIQLLRRKVIDNRTALPLNGIGDMIFTFEKINAEVPIYGYQLTFQVQTNSLQYQAFYSCRHRAMDRNLHE